MKGHGCIKRFGTFWTCLLLLVGTAGLSFAADGKFATLNLADVGKNSAKVKMSLADLKNLQVSEMAKIGALKQEADKLQEQLKSQNDSLNKEEKEKLQAAFLDKTQELQAEQQAANIKRTFQQKKIQNAIKAQIKEAIAKIAKEEGVTAVFLSDMLLYSEGMVDLTDKVTKAIDSMPPIETGTQ